MAVIGVPRSFHNKFKFQLEIDDIGRASFQSCSELKVEVQKIEYSEGGMLIPYKEPGRLSYSDLTLERACTESNHFMRWVEATADATKHGGSLSFKKTGTIIQYDRRNTRIREWQLTGIWPVGFTAGSWDNNSDEFTMEQIVLAYDYFTLGRNVNPTAVAENILSGGTQYLKKEFYKAF